MSRILPALALLSAFALTSCESVDVPFLAKKVILQCPDYFILEDAATLTKFIDGKGRDLTDIDFKAKMGEMQLVCITDVDPETDSGNMTIEVSPIIAAEMGPANTTDAAILPYFVVITDPDKKILYREELSITVSFSGNRTQIIVAAKPTAVEIPITPSIRNNYYRVYSGFELTREQVEQNRKAIRDQLQ